MFAKIHAGFMALLVSIGLAHPGAVTYQGYGEGEYVLVAPQIAGTLEALSVARGQTIHKGDALFTLEHADEAAALEQAKAQSVHAQSTLNDLLKGKRQAEIDTLMAQRDQASAALDLATINYKRDEQQFKIKAVSQAVLDADKAALDQARARLAETEADLANGLQSTGRADVILAAEADLNASKAAVASAQWRLDQKTLVAPADSFVFDTLYRPGEYIPAGQAVVSLLPPPNIRARFFVPEPQLAKIPAGTEVKIKCDSCDHPIAARVTYVSPQAEYSPPQLYNRDNRARLLYMLEATPSETPELLHPGQPVDVTVGEE